MVKNCARPIPMDHVKGEEQVYLAQGTGASEKDR